MAVRKKVLGQIILVVVLLVAGTAALAAFVFVSESTAICYSFEVRKKYSNIMTRMTTGI